MGLRIHTHQSDGRQHVDVIGTDDLQAAARAAKLELDLIWPSGNYVGRAHYEDESEYVAFTEVLPFRVGDWALHVSGQLDSREVAEIDYDGVEAIKLHLPGGVSEAWFPSANYENLGPRG